MVFPGEDLINTHRKHEYGSSPSSRSNAGTRDSGHIHSEVFRESFEFAVEVSHARQPCVKGR